MIVNQSLLRVFPLYSKKSKTITLTGETSILQYKLIRVKKSWVLVLTTSAKLKNRVKTKKKSKKRIKEKLKKQTEVTQKNKAKIYKGDIGKIIELAKSKAGSIYHYGEKGPDKFDCSGFVYYVYRQNDIPIPRTSKLQSESGEKLMREEIKKGDMLFFDTAERGHVNHSGVYLGNGKFIHASSGSVYGVTVSSLDKGFYLDKFRWGVRKVN